MRKVLNVGGNSKEIPLPPCYAGWQHDLLDIDPKVHPDVLCDARELLRLQRAQYDSVYCSHNLEHYYRHEVPRVLAGFRHVLKEDGFANIIVPDVGAVMREAIERGLDIEDVLYTAPAGPITVRDVIYGYGVEIERSGVDFYAHKTGFTEKSLIGTLQDSGFPIVYVATGSLEVRALAFTGTPGSYAKALLDLP